MKYDGYILLTSGIEAGNAGTVVQGAIGAVVGGDGGVGEDLLPIDAQPDTEKSLHQWWGGEDGGVGEDLLPINAQPDREMCVQVSLFGFFYSMFIETFHQLKFISYND